MIELKWLKMLKQKEKWNRKFKRNLKKLKHERVLAEFVEDFIQIKQK